MKLFFHYCPFGFSNCYVLGAEKPADEGGKTGDPMALLVDPGVMDKVILNFIENNNYTLGGVLITHDHRNHVHGLRTLRRIYNTEIYAINHIILDYRTTMVRDGDVFDIGPFSLEVISVPGHSSDSAVFKVERFLFTGDALSAGLVGSTASSYGAAVQTTALRSRIFSLPGDYIVLPGHGPPSSLEAERCFNAGIEQYEQHKNRRPQFAPEFFE
ncbi:MAG: MBL fold metallo-hydrolase [Spirochaetaceae bacterium]|jgi:glyoxylase-like metal-dependent hydrolase (beta-lactamase superfamily II)|nr:MBL fold metallo-hydrolase [Spirochaetaceae bacterium]